MVVAVRIPLNFFLQPFQVMGEEIQDIDPSLRSPDLPYHFIPLPSNNVWDNIIIQASPGKGEGLFLKSGRRGMLIPYGGRFISEEERKELKKKKKYLDKYTIDATYQDQRGMFDRHLDAHLNWSSPASYVNEASCVTEKYNSQFWLLDRTEYLDMPDYPHMPGNRYLIFLEAMISVNLIPNGERNLRGRDFISAPDGLELFAFYGRTNVGPGYRRDYVPLPLKGNMITSQNR